MNDFQKIVNYKSKEKWDVGRSTLRWKDRNLFQRTEQVSNGLIHKDEEDYV